MRSKKLIYCIWWLTDESKIELVGKFLQKADRNITLEFFEKRYTSLDFAKTKKELVKKIRR